MTHFDGESPRFLKREFTEPEWKSWFEQQFDVVKNINSESPTRLPVGGDIEASFSEVLSNWCYQCRIQREDSPRLRQLKYRSIAKIVAEIIDRNLESDLGREATAYRAVEYLNNSHSLLNAIGDGVLDRGVHSIEGNIMRAVEVLGDSAAGQTQLNFIYEALSGLRNAPGLTIDGYKLGAGPERRME
jgi:hypothetical protein